MKCESKQHTANAPAAFMYETLGNFENLSPMLKDKVEDWSATADSCSFKAQGMSMTLYMDREAMEAQSRAADGVYTIKIFTADSPMPFGMWLQLKATAPYQTRLRVVADIELNAMYKMLIGKKIQKGVDQFAEQIARGFGGV